MPKSIALPLLTAGLVFVASSALAGGMRFEEVDLNGDQLLDKAELETAFGSAAAAGLLADDANGNGLSPEEILAKQADEQTEGTEGTEGTETDTAEEQGRPTHALHGQFRAAQAHATADARRAARAEEDDSSEERSRGSEGRGRGQQGPKGD